MSLTEQNSALNEILTGISLTKCQQCGCMRETLEQIGQALPQLPREKAGMFRMGMVGWLEKMTPERYACLGCEHCYAGSAQNAFTSAFPDVAGTFGLSCEIQVQEGEWPPVVGDYLVLDQNAPVAVVTLASLDLPKIIAEEKVEGLAIVGKMETENIGVEKLIKNMIANPRLRFLVIAGKESPGHSSGQTLIALAENGVDRNRRVIGSQGKQPVLRNLTMTEVETFRQQVRMLNLIGCEDIKRIRGLVEELASPELTFTVEVVPCGCLDDT